MASDFHFDTDRIDWIHLQGGDEFDYAIDYKLAVLGCEPEVGSLDLLIEFAPDSHCHFHRHLAPTTVIVLRGEQHVFEKAATGETIHKVRRAGEYAHSPGGEAHMERGGPEGALVFFSFVAPDGRLFELLDAGGNVQAETTLEELAAGQAAIEAAASSAAG